MLKKCKRCLEEKEISSFTNSHIYCKACRNEQVKISRQKNPERYRQKDCEWRENNPKRRLLICTRQSAKLKGLEHNIEEIDLELPEYCPLLGIKIDYSAGNGKTMEKPSIDRIDPTKGYVKGNVELISSLANTMKSKATPEQLIFFAKEILKRYESWNH